MKKPYWKEFAEAGIMGINARNLDYIFTNNHRSKYPLVDDKVLTKELAIKAGIPTPEVYHIIEFQQQVAKMPEALAAHNEFVVKPAKGSGGGGIIVITGKAKSGYRKQSGEIMQARDMDYHIYNTLGGMYSLGGQPDRVIIEYKVDFNPVFSDIAYKGVPDIRLVVFRGVPTMAMLRLPTRESDGKANLHMGGIGVGISMKTGRTTTAVHRGDEAKEHPETGHSISGYQIPDWRMIMEMSARFYDITGLGYIGVDIVLDRTKGPMMLEVNARPGIAIQVANQEGLITRLKKVEENLPNLHSIEAKVDFAMDAFG
jgi:alpha-L-glutamate ligase-like protein